ncbi:hypothetical protein [uncultured Flavobacterium sp.]|mgnify:CR=1 FL=1|uniref:hypothetical protein n=1 Tax=uncultured Flavobacterium sp. TaxID=165435 RepID=UPI0025F02EC0|nr:hypothetical protein [uncultured Flavobacterium sp.]
MKTAICLTCFLLFFTSNLKAQNLISYKEYQTTYSTIKDSVIKVNRLIAYNDTLHFLSYQFRFPFKEQDFYAFTTTQEFSSDSLVINPKKIDLTKYDSLINQYNDTNFDRLHYRLDNTAWKGDLYWQQILEAKALGKEIEKEFDKFGIVAYWDVIFRYHNSQKDKLDYDNHITFLNSKDKNKKMQLLLNFFKRKEMLNKVTIARCIVADDSLKTLMKYNIGEQNWFYEIIFPANFQGNYLLPDFTSNMRLD